jgi:hypothetical protein
MQNTTYKLYWTLPGKLSGSLPVNYAEHYR